MQLSKCAKASNYTHEAEELPCVFLSPKWLGVPLASLDAEEIEVGIKKYLKEACIALQNFPGDPVAAEFKKQVESWLSRLPLILDLGNPALKRRHWETIFDELK